MSTFTYLKSFFKDKDVASVTPTSKFCMRQVCSPINFNEDLTIIEYGAGSGVYARFLLPKMTDQSQLHLFETNDLLFKKLKKINDTRLSFYDKSVKYVTDLVPDQLVGQTDYIISGIPFSFLDEETKASVLSQSVGLLKEGGKFLAYQTSGHLEEPLKNTFGNVHTEWEWRNIPPMTVYEAEKSTG
jgi:phospholipid N-methyltransferase